MSAFLAFNSAGQKLRETFRFIKTVHGYDPARRRTSLRGPTILQIQTIDRCNAACIMCPYSSKSNNGTANFMDDKLYMHILEELYQPRTVQTICMMLQNEPLLDRTLPERIRIAKKLFGPGVRIITVTNGAPLTDSVIKDLRNSAIDGMSVSIDSIQPETYRKIRPGLDLQQVLRNTLSLIEHLGPSRVKIKFVRQRDNEGEEIAFARFWHERGVRVIFSNLTSRAGSLKGYETLKKTRPDKWKRAVHPILNRLVPACPLPFTSLNVLWDGRVITCVEDWAIGDILGDISRQSLVEIWNGEKINNCRHLLWTHHAQENPVCTGCSLANHYWHE